MYLKDLTRKMTVRFSEETWSWICASCDEMEISPSDFVRCCVATQRAALDRIANTLKEGSDDGKDHKQSITI